MDINFVKIAFYLQMCNFFSFFTLGGQQGLVRLRTLSLIYSLQEIYFSGTAITVCKTIQLQQKLYKLNNNCKTNKNSMDKKKKCIIDEYKTVYGFSLFVIINPDKSIVDKRFSFRNDESSIMDDEWSDYTAYTVRGAYDKIAGEDCEIIVINKLKNTSDDINTFAHESFHAAVDILEACHIKLSEDTNEVFAYLIGYFTECVNKTASKV